MKDELTKGLFVDITTIDGKIISGKIVKIEQDYIKIKQSPYSESITVPKQEIKAVRKWNPQPLDVEDEKDEP